jgi:hypothetical protein
VYNYNYNYIFIYILNMKKKEWGNAVWLLFHTLAFKLKDEYISELPILISNISSICNHLPCPDCQQHATSVMNNINKAHLSSSKNTLINFLWEFHNHVNKKIKGEFYPKEKLSIYETTNTKNVISNFINIMKSTSNNEKTMMYGFHRTLYIKKFITYINENGYKYNL